MARPRKTATKLPPYVREKHGAYHYDRPGVLSRKLCRVEDGIPAMHEALAAVLKDLADGSPLKGMPKLCADWKREPVRDRGLQKYAPKVRKEYERMLDHVAKWFVNFDVHQVKTHHIAKALDTKFPDKPRSHNAYRALLALLFRYAMVKGLRTDNPVTRESLGTMRESKRKRYITDDELAIIKANGDEKLSLVIDLAYITGQRIGDLLALTWASVSDKGILFEPGKTKDSTEIPVPVKMTDELRTVLEGLKGGVEPLPTAPVIRTQTGGRYTYSGIYSAWRRACLPDDEDKPRVLNAHIHDLRRKALTDLRDQKGEAAAQALAGHAKLQMTKRYFEQTDLQWVEPVRMRA